MNWFFSTSEMPRKAKQVSQPEAPVVEEPTDVGNEPTVLTKDDYNKARATIKSYREAQKAKPKRKCSEAQLAALKAGREKNKRFANKTTGQNQ